MRPTDASDEPLQGEANTPHVPDEEADLVGRQARRLVEEEAATPRSATEEGAGLEPDTPA